jgi:hypothetical protein
MTKVFVCSNKERNSLDALDRLEPGVELDVPTIVSPRPSKRTSRQVVSVYKFSSKPNNSGFFAERDAAGATIALRPQSVLFRRCFGV